MISQKNAKFSLLGDCILNIFYIFVTDICGCKFVVWQTCDRNFFSKRENPSLTIKHTLM